MKALLTILLLISFNSEIFSQPTIYHVRTDGDDTNTGLSWVEAFATVQKALDSADSLDQIWIAEGTYHPTSDYGLVAEGGVEQERSKHFRMKNGVTIYGGFPITGNPGMDNRDWENYETIFDGEIGDGINVYHVFYHPVELGLDSTAVIDGVVITRGGGYWEHARNGGGMYNVESHPTIRNSTFKYNYAFDGGGIYNKYSNVIIENSKFYGNNADALGGGAIYNYYSKPIIINSVFYQNSPGLGAGGGIYNYHSDPKIENSIFSENDPWREGRGGGIFNSHSNPHIIDSKFISNNSYYGGAGIYNYYSDPLIGNCFLYNNLSEYGAGGILNRNSNPKIINTSIINNTVNDGISGGGVYNNNSNPTFINCVIANNHYHGHDGVSGIYNINSNTIFINCTITNNRGIGEGGGIYNSSGIFLEGFGSHAVLINSIIFGNEGGILIGNQIFNDDNSSATLNYSLYSNKPDDIREGGGFTATNSITDDPLFVGPEVNPDHPFLIYGNSPAVDAGSNELIPEDIEFDIRGEPRIVAGFGETAQVDIGAYEWQPDKDPVKPSIRPVSTPPHNFGMPFVVDINVGTPGEVTDLYGVSFTLKCDQPECMYVDDSAEAGDFLGSSPIFFTEKIDEQTLDVTVTRTSPPGVSGSGTVARAHFTTPAEFKDSLEVKFSLENVSAINSIGEEIDMIPTSLYITIFEQEIIVWPGDTNNDGKVDASDILPIGLYYGQTRPGENNPGIEWQGFVREPWSADGETPRRVFADANGDGVINAQDVLAIGINYGKTHSDAAPALFVGKDEVNKRTRKTGGILDLNLLNSENAEDELAVQVWMNSVEPVYGISFKVRIEDAKGLRESYAVNTVDGVLGTDILHFNKFLSEEGLIDIALSKKEGDGFMGEGELLRLNVGHEYELGSNISIVLEDIVGNNVEGYPLMFDSAPLEFVLGESDMTIPTEFSLSQNYPNPFNPVTTIEYGLPNESHIMLVVYDMLGREVTRLVNETQPAGMHRVNWDSSEARVSSGIYIYRIAATSTDGDKKFIESRRMILMK